jgi:hypothetical protein
MCCQTTHHAASPHCTCQPMAGCGCGCMGRDQSVRNLETYREHLKVQLASVEKQIQAARKTNP